MTTHCVFETRLGFVALAARDGKLTHSTLPRPSRREAFEALTAGLDDPGVEDVAAFGNLPERLRRYLRGERVDFWQVALHVSGAAPFRAAVLLAAQRIPYGETVTYGDLARMAGSERAARAAGSAMAHNTMPIIVPCHRVVASDGGLGGFSGGLEWKRTLLALEGVDV